MDNVDYAHQSYKDLFDPETLFKIKGKNPDVSLIDLFSIGNASIRPSGASYRDRLYSGEFNSQGLDALDEFLSSSQGFMVYQEQIIDFLVQFCDYTGGQADLVRRGIGKKDKELLAKLIPEIKERFISTLINRYDVAEDEVEEIAMSFIQVIIDASDYGFSINHSDSYSWMGYASAWLRFYHTLEFITANLNVNIGKKDKTSSLVEYAKLKDISINSIKFRYSRAGYMFDRENDSIYQGISPIKFLNSSVAEGLYDLRERKYETFTDLLIDIKDGSTLEIGDTKVDMRDFLKSEIDKDSMKIISKEEKDKNIKFTNSIAVPANARQIKILIYLNFFEEFGGNQKLLNIYEAFEKHYSVKHKLKTKRERYAKVLQIESDMPEEKLSLVEQCTAELEFLGHIETVSESMNPSILILTEVKVMKSYTRAKAYQFSSGELRDFKMGSRLYAQVPFDEMDVIQIVSADVKPKNKKIGGVWQKSPTEKEVWLKEIQFIRKGVISDDQS